MIFVISIIISFVLVLFSIIYYYCTSTFEIWKKLKVPYVQPVPLFGNYLNVALGVDHPVDTYKSIYYELAGHKYGGYFQMRTPYLMIRDPEMINDILIKDFSNFCNRGVYTDYSSNPLTNNLFFMYNPQWKIMRNKLTPAFTSGKLKQMYDQINGCSMEMLKNIYNQLMNNSNEIEIRDIMGKYSTDVIGICAFGLKLNTISDDNSAFRKYGKAIFEPSLRAVIRELCLMVSPKVLKILRFPNFPIEATEFFRSAFQKTIKYREKNNLIRNDLVQHLIQARQDLVLNSSNLALDEQFTELQIVANAFAMFAAGFETVSTTISFCLYELALKKHIQDKVREEIKSKKLKFNGVMNNDFLMDFEYLNMVIEETLRKYPPTFALFREASQTYHVRNDSLVIEKGQKVMIPIYSLHYNPNYFNDPEVFDPERFSSEEIAKRPSGIYLPFGNGPRMCIAKRFAEIEMKLALVEVLSKFELEPCEKTEIPIRYSKRTAIIISPKDGSVWLKFNSISAE